MSSQSYDCSICQKSLNSEDQLSQHMKGQSHLAKVKRLELEEQIKSRDGAEDDSTSSYYVRSCDYPDDVPSLKGSSNKPLQSKGNVQGASYIVPPCKICIAEFNCEKDRENHLKGKTHLSKVKRLEELNKAGANHTSSNSLNSSGDENPNDFNIKVGNAEQSIQSDASLSQAQRPAFNANDLNRSISGSDKAQDRSTQLRALLEGNENECIFDNSTKKGSCFICNIQFSSEQQAIDHIESLGHAKKKRSLTEELPSRVLTSQSAVGAAAIPSLPQNIGNSSLISPQNNENVQGLNSEFLPCDLCNASFNCKKDRENHLNGKSHLKELRKREEEVEQTKKKGLFAPGQQITSKDEEQTNRKEFCQSGASPVIDEVLLSQNQTQVKELSEKPTAVVPPQSANYSTTPLTGQRNRHDSVPEDGPSVVIPNIPNQDGRNPDSYCNVCCIPLTSPEHAAEHYSGQRHRKLEKRQQAQLQDDDRKKVTVSLKLKLEM